MATLKTLVFDIETNGLLNDLDRLHCMVVTDADTGETHGFADQPGYSPLQQGLDWLAEADVIVGHNIIGFDLPALEKVYAWKPAKRQIIRDTMVLAPLVWPHIKDNDFGMAKQGRLPKVYIGRHSLAAWGFRLGVFKDEYSGGWDAWSKEMHDYMMQDAVVTLALWQRCCVEIEKWGVVMLDDNPQPRRDCVVLEHHVAMIVSKVERHGFRFDTAAAVALVEQLTARRRLLTEELQEVFPPDTVEQEFIPKVNNKKLGYVKGIPFTKRWQVAFNPGSRQMVASRLQRLGWKPSQYGKDGIPTIDDDILEALPYPEAKKLAEFFTVQKRIGQIAEGKEAWFKHVKKGRIHGRIYPNGAHTGRATHSSPNIAQVPKVGSAYGAECRACFVADEGHVLVGWDADALELRDLAGYMAAWDEGAYVDVVLKGDKSNGTDMHSINAKLLGCSRDVAKVWFYAMAYGSGDMNLGSILGFSGRKAMTEGKRARARLMAGLPALNSLITAVQKAVATRGFLTGLDGRRYVVRSENAALNTLLQGAGAIQMKRAMVNMYYTALQRGYEWGKDWAIVAWIHDEIQSTARPDIAEDIGKIGVEAMRKAGEFYSFRCPLAGNADIGANWKETH